MRSSNLLLTFLCAVSLSSCKTDEKRTFLVTFNSNGGSLVESQRVLEGDRVKKPNNPTKTGFDFVNWTFSEEEWSFVNNFVVGDMTLDANWALTNYTITYNIEDGYFDLPQPTSFTMETETFSIGSPKRDHYTFVGWSSNLDSNVKETYSVEKGTTQNLVLNAHWDIDKFQVRWCNSDGSLLETDTDVPYGSTPQFNGETPEKQKDNEYTYTFSGWTPALGPVTQDITYFATFSKTGNPYNVYVVNEHPERGTVNGAGEYSYNEYVYLSVTENTGYTFEGWYLDNNKVSSLLGYRFYMPSHDFTIEARFSVNKYSVWLESEDGFKGHAEGTGSYEYNSEVTIVATPLPGYSFAGWFTNSDELVSNLSEFTFTMPASSLSYIAKFSTNSYILEVESEDSEKGTVSGGGNYLYNSDVKVETLFTSTFIEEQSIYKVTFKGWFLDDECVSENTSYSFKMPAKNIKLIARFSEKVKVATRNGSTVTFGSFPQTKVTNTEVINELETLAGDLPTSSDSKLWNKYVWYIDANALNAYGWYIDIDLDKDGSNDYRGVYFTSYRPYSADGVASSTSNSYQDDNGYNKLTIHWFKYEPLTWRLLSSSNEDWFLMSDRILDNECFYPSNTGVWCNNYSHSNLKNSTSKIFSVFNDYEKAAVVTTSVDNSAETTADNPNAHACGTTSQKLFCLSYRELTNTDYGFSSYSPSSDSKKSLSGSDYAYCMGLRDWSGKGCWWTRSPRDFDEKSAWYVASGGSMAAPQVASLYGVVPALHLSLV